MVFENSCTLLFKFNHPLVKLLAMKVETVSPLTRTVDFQPAAALSFVAPCHSGDREFKSP